MSVFITAVLKLYILTQTGGYSLVFTKDIN